MEFETAKFRMKENMGIHRYKGKTYRPGDVIECPPYLLRHCLDKFEKLDGSEVTEDDVEPQTKPVKPMEAVHKGFGRYDVVNPATGKAINDKPLSKSEAMALAGMEPEPEKQEGPDEEPEQDGDAA